MGMTDAFLILTPFLLLVVVALLGFVGCASFSATDSSAATALNLSASPSNVGAGGDSILTWNASGTQTAAIDQSVGTVYTYDATKPSAPTTGTTTVNPVATTTYTLSGKDTAGGPINVTVTPGTPPPNVATVTVSAPIVMSISPPSGPVTGGTNVTVAGQLFGKPVDLTLGSVAAMNIKRISDTSLTATTQGQAPGVVGVTVTNRANGQSFTLPNAFTYTPAIPTGTVVTHLQTVLTGPSAGTTVSASLPAFPGAGKLVVVTVQWGGTGTLTLSSTPAVSFTQIELDNLNPQQVATFVAMNVSGAIKITATLSIATTTDFNLLVSAYDNVAAGSVPDNAGKMQGTGTALTLAFATAGLTAGDLVYAIAVARNNSLVLTGSLSPGMAPNFVPESGQGSYLLLEDYALTAGDLGSPQINVNANNASGTATARWYVFAMRIKHA